MIDYWSMVLRKEEVSRQLYVIYSDSHRIANTEVVALRINSLINSQFATITPIANGILRHCVQTRANCSLKSANYYFANCTQVSLSLSLFARCEAIVEIESRRWTTRFIISPTLQAHFCSCGQLGTWLNARKGRLGAIEWCSIYINWNLGYFQNWV